jgi:hypothetical protein
MIVLFAWHRGSVKAVLRAWNNGLIQPGEGWTQVRISVFFSVLSATCRPVS